MDISRKEILDGISILFAEKRTALAILRSAFTIFVFPLSVFTLLVTTSQFYNNMESFHLITPLIIVCFVLIMIGVYLVYRSINRIIIIDKDIEKLKNI